MGAGERRLEVVLHMDSFSSSQENLTRQPSFNTSKSIRLCRLTAFSVSVHANGCAIVQYTTHKEALTFQPLRHGNSDMLFGCSALGNGVQKKKIPTSRGLVDGVESWYNPQ